jgi:hypothetical protein
MGAALRAAAATLALFVAAPFPALAHDHEPPRALLRHGTLEQEGRLIALRWTEPAGPDGCTSTLLLAKPRYPREGLPVGQGDFRARIRFAKPARPLSVQAVARPELDVEGDLTGRAADLAIRLRPRRPDGDVRAWAAIVTSRVEEDLYLRVTARWRDRDGCGDKQRATWTFHVSAA